jgi:hypothetical protein
VGGEVDLLEGPALAVWQIFDLEAGKEAREQRRGLLAGLVVDFRP